jgi:hypothetical protein
MFRSSTDDIFKTTARLQVLNTSAMEDVIIRIIKNTCTKNADNYITAVCIVYISVAYYGFL